VNTFNIADLTEGYFFTEDAFLDKKFLLLTPGVPITDTLKKALRDWDFFKLYSEGHTSEQPVIRTLPSMTEATAGAEAGEKKDANEDQTPMQQLSEESRFDLVEKTYNDYQDFISQVYTRYATRKELQLQLISDKVKDLCDFIKENKRYVLRILPSQENRDKSSSFRSTN